jgi:hypothetical protein
MAVRHARIALVAFYKGKGYKISQKSNVPYIAAIAILAKRETSIFICKFFYFQPVNLLFLDGFSASL